MTGINWRWRWRGRLLKREEDQKTGRKEQNHENQNHEKRHSLLEKAFLFSDRRGKSFPEDLTR
jgi:hypothetical protein